MGYYYQDSVNPSLGHTASFAYDALNRLKTAQTKPTDPSQYNFAFSYDSYGNMSCTANPGQCAVLAYGSNNRITTSGYTYDAAGDLTSDGASSYQWDAEGRIKAVVQGGNTYSTTVFNAFGQAVETTYPTYNVKTEGLFDPAGREMGYLNGTTGAWWDRDIWLGNRMIAQSYVSDTYFLHKNALGSDSQITDASGAVVTDFVYYPWQMWTYAGSEVDAHFAGFEQSGGVNYPTPARMYSGNQGRWLSPDPMGGDVANPQSFNRYAYVMNNPGTLTDPSGLGSLGCPPHAPAFICQDGTYYPPGGAVHLEPTLSGTIGGWDYFSWLDLGATTVSQPVYSGSADDLTLVGYNTYTIPGSTFNVGMLPLINSGGSSLGATFLRSAVPVSVDHTGACSAYSATGTATYYNLPGQNTASGAPFNPNTMSAAMFQPGVVHMGDVMQVNLVNNRGASVTVTINDTGPFLRGPDGRALTPLQPDPSHLIDLTPAAFMRLNGSLTAGHVQVDVNRACQGG